MVDTMNRTFAEAVPVDRGQALCPMVWRAIDSDYSMETLMYDVVNPMLALTMRWTDILVIGAALEPVSDVADAFAVDAIANLCHHWSNDDDANEDASDDLMEFAFLLRFLAFDAADICNRDALSCGVLCREEK